MSKRKADEASKTKMDVDGEDSGSDNDQEMINVDFEFFDPEEIDFHGLKTLIRQLLDVDNKLFDLSPLAETILSQPQLGTTIKCDGQESDPYAFIALINAQQHKDTPSVKAIAEYIATKADNPKIGELLAAESKAQVGLVFSERFINMPHQIVPPLYTMLQNELAAAVSEKATAKPTHYFILSKTYTEVDSMLDAEDNPPSKKSKANKATSEVFYFHPEDEVLAKHAFAVCSWDYTNQGGAGESDARRTFQELGIRPRGHLMAIEAAKFEGAVKAVGEYLA